MLLKHLHKVLSGWLILKLIGIAEHVPTVIAKVGPSEAFCMSGVPCGECDVRQLACVNAVRKLQMKAAGAGECLAYLPHSAYESKGLDQAEVNYDNLERQILGMARIEAQKCTPANTPLLQAYHHQDEACSIGPTPQVVQLGHSSQRQLESGRCCDLCQPLVSDFAQDVNLQTAARV